MKKFIINLIILTLIKTSFTQNKTENILFLNYASSDYTSVYEINARNKYKGHIFYCEILNGDFENRYGKASVFAVPKHFPEIFIKRIDAFCKDSSEYCKQKKLTELGVNIFTKDSVKLKTDFDFYTFFIPKQFCKTFRWENTENGKFYNEYYPIKNTYCKVLKLNESKWQQIDSVKNIRGSSPKSIGLDYLNNLYQTRIFFQYILTKDLNKFSKNEIDTGIRIVEHLYCLSNDIINKNNEKYNKDLNLLKRNISKVSKNETFNTPNLIFLLLLKDFYNHKNESEDFFTNKKCVINSIYAINGYKFKNKKWSDIFLLFPWYKPYTKFPDFNNETRNILKFLSK